MIKLSPSILSADFANLQRDIAIAVDAGAEYVHVDCMDGHFVPNLTIGAPVVKALRKATDATLDVHLMISNPDQYLDDFIKAGSDIITVHYEANGDTLAQVRKIKEAGVRACVSIKPGTPADVLLPLLPELDADEEEDDPLTAPAAPAQPAPQPATPAADAPARTVTSGLRRKKAVMALRALRRKLGEV